MINDLIGLISFIATLCLMCLLGMLVSTFNFKKLREKLKEFYIIICNFIGLIFAIVTIFLINLIINNISLKFLVLELIILIATSLFSSISLTRLFYKNNSKKQLGKEYDKIFDINIPFIVNCVIWTSYIIFTIINQLYQLEIINVQTSEIIDLLKVNEGAIIIYLAIVSFVSIINTFIKTKKMIKENRKNDNEDENN